MSISFLKVSCVQAVALLLNLLILNLMNYDRLPFVQLKNWLVFVTSSAIDAQFDFINRFQTLKILKHNAGNEDLNFS